VGVALIGTVLVWYARQKEQQRQRDLAVHMLLSRAFNEENARGGSRGYF